MTTTTDLAHVPQQPLAVMPIFQMDQAKQRHDEIVRFVQDIMKKDIDYGEIPGTNKPTLLKPGAERLISFFGLSPKFLIVEKVEDWTGKTTGGEPLFYYFYKCQLWRGDYFVGEADGSCNSRESKYRWRWVRESELPANADKSKLATRGGTTTEFAFAIDKKETGGAYGKPAEYWAKWERAIEDGSARPVKKKTKSNKEMDAWEMDTKVYRIPSDDVASQVNTIQKMAQKRALVAVTLIAVNASEFFTQDLDDLDTFDVDWHPAAPKAPPAAPQQQQQQGDPAAQTKPPAAENDDPEPNLMDDVVFRRCYAALHAKRPTRATAEEANEVIDGVLKSAKPPLVDADGRADLGKVTLQGRQVLLKRAEEGTHDKWVEHVRKAKQQAATSAA